MRQGGHTARAPLLLGVTILIMSGFVGLAAFAQAAKTESQSAQKRQAPPPQVRHGTNGLPRPVLDLHEAMTGAIEAGQIEELRQAYELSEPKPDLDAPSTTDPVAHWKSISGDGQGRDVLAALSLILDAGYVVIPRGADIENNRLYVWPYFAEIPLAQLTPRQEVELLRLVPATAVREMKDKGKYTYWRLIIGADGTWHALRKGD